MKRTLLIIFLAWGFNSSIYSQAKTNLDLIYELLENSVLKTESLLNNRNFAFHFVYKSPESFSFLKTNLISYYLRNGITLKESDSCDAKLEHTVKNIKVEYSNPFKDGFFGDLLVERTIYLDANLLLSDKTGINTFDLSNSIKDTVAIANIDQIENPNVEFTKATIPELPFFSNLLEPIIVVGTLIVTIVLFFTVRSK